MNRNIRLPLLFISLFSLLSIVANAQSWPEELLLTPEKTNYEKTSTYADVMSFLNAVTKQTENIRVMSIGKSLEGKDIPVAILANPMVNSAEEAKESGKLIVYIQGNIHAGEIEGKEVVMMMLRDNVFSKQAILDELIVLFAPIYNTDSNDKMAFGRRPSQENSPPEVGIRENSEGLDLNRDGTKMEALETNALFQVINEWDPQLFVDLHTTNGTWHGWDLTWAPSYHYAGEKAPYDLTVKMLKHISTVVPERYGKKFGPFGDYDLRDGWPVKNFYTYNHHPRYLVNQFGLRNRMGILSESFAHEKFEERINSTYAFVKEILNYAAENSEEIRYANKDAEQATINRIDQEAGKVKKGVRFKMVPLETLTKFPTYNYKPETQPDGKIQLKRQPEKVILDSVVYYAAFKAEVESTLPSGYVIPAEFVKVIDNLKKHGIEVKQLNKKTTFTGEYFEIEKYELAQRKFEGHQMARATGKFVKVRKKFGKGDVVVDLAQPLGNLAFYLLEPESDDGLVTWNFFNEDIEKQKRHNTPRRYPVFKFYKTK